MTLLIAEGPNFYFHLLSSNSKKEAEKQFAKAWEKHARQTGASVDYEDAVTVNFIENFEINKCYRDYESL